MDWPKDSPTRRGSSRGRIGNIEDLFPAGPGVLPHPSSLASISADLAEPQGLYPSTFAHHATVSRLPKPGDEPVAYPMGINLIAIQVAPERPVFQVSADDQEGS